MLVNNSIPETHRANQILWLALLMGATMITAVMVYLNYQSPDFMNFNNFVTSIFAGIGAVLSILGLFLPNSVIRNRVENSKAIELTDKFAEFRAHVVLKSAFHEGAALICALFMHSEHNFYFIFLVAFNLILLYGARPTIKKFKDWFRLSNEEEQELNSMKFLPLFG